MRIRKIEWKARKFGPDSPYVVASTDTGRGYGVWKALFDDEGKPTNGYAAVGSGDGYVLAAALDRAHSMNAI
jgi:hypothetical protein